MFLWVLSKGFQATFPGDRGKREYGRWNFRTCWACEGVKNGPKDDGHCTRSGERAHRAGRPRTRGCLLMCTWSQRATVPRHRPTSPSSSLTIDAVTPLAHLAIYVLRRFHDKSSVFVFPFLSHGENSLQNHTLIMRSLIPLMLRETRRNFWDDTPFFNLAIANGLSAENRKPRIRY